LFIPRLDSIAIMFGLGITFDAIITFALYLYLVKLLNKKSSAITSNAVTI